MFVATIYDLLKRVNYLVDDTIETEIALEFINEALEDLSSVAGVEQKTVYPMRKNEGKLSVPLNTIELVAVYVKDNGLVKRATAINDVENTEYHSFGYRLFGSELEIFPKLINDYEVIIESFITFPKLTITQIETPIETVTKLPVRFHRALSTYCAIQYAENDDNIHKINNLKMNYETVKMELKKDMDKKRTKVRGNKVVITSGWY